MAIKYLYEAESDIPANVRDLYSEQGGKFVLTGVEGVKPQTEFERVYGAHNREKDEHRATKARLQAWGDLNPEEVLAQLDRIKELETLAGGKLDDKALDALVENRIGTRIGPVKRAKDQAEAELAEARKLIEQLSGERKATKIRDEVTRAAIAAKVLDTALEDVQILAERYFDLDDQGRVVVKETGIQASDWLADQKAKRPHWFPGSRGGASGGSGTTETGGANPWSKDGWSMTEQSRIVLSKGIEYAEKLAGAAGSKVGATKPPA